MRIKNPSLGIIYALGAAMLFGLNASTSKIIVAAGIQPSSLVFFRSLACALLAGFLLLVTNQSAFRIQVDEIPRLLLFGLFGVALMQWAYSNAVSRLPVGIALLLEYTAVVWVPLASRVIWKERTRKRLWIGVVLVLFGLVAISQIWNGGLDAIGIGFAALASVLLSMFFLMGEHTQQRRGAISTMFYTMSFSTVFWLIFSPWWQFDAARLTTAINLTGNLSQFQFPFVGLLIWVGLAGSFLPMLLTYAALGEASAVAVGIASVTEVVFAAFFGWLWLNEKLDGLQLLGGVMLIVGIVVAQTARLRRE